jgi:hypothetical protein
VRVRCCAMLCVFPCGAAKNRVRPRHGIDRHALPKTAARRAQSRPHARGTAPPPWAAALRGGARAGCEARRGDSNRLAIGPRATFKRLGTESQGYAVSLGSHKGCWVRERGGRWNGRGR